MNLCRRFSNDSPQYIQHQTVKPSTLPVYLDHNASTPVLPEVVDAMLPYLQEHYGNPSSNHIFGSTMHQAVERAREQTANLIECNPGEVFFTSGGTEANNLAIRGVAAAIPARRHLLISVIEHPATVGPAAWLEQQGYRLSRVAVDGVGRVSPQNVQECLGQDTALVSIMHANSETGTIQPIAEIASLAHCAGALIHSDAAQSCGKIPVSTRREEVDLLSIAGHKLYAPQGVGGIGRRVEARRRRIGRGADQGNRPLNIEVTVRYGHFEYRGLERIVPGDSEVLGGIVQEGCGQEGTGIRGPSGPFMNKGRTCRDRARC